MADDWKPGDLAMCVHVGTWRDYGVGPSRGQVIEVADVFPPDEVGELIGDDYHPCFLGFTAWLPANAFGCGHFRKIPPLTNEDRDSFLADLKLPAPLVEA